MFARIVEFTCYTGQTKELCRAIDQKVLPVLKKQQGFCDAITFVSNNDPQRVLGISFWNNREDAERYHRQEYGILLEMLRSFSRPDPKVETFEVESSTSHHISMGQAA